jgi:ABC-type Fe3+-hydroxamate transport system substrate-binding protein
VTGFSDLPSCQRPYRSAYFIWQKPTMVAGSNTFIDDMLTRLGFVNAFANGVHRYPEISHEQIKQANLDLILLSSEPFPFQEKQKYEFEERCPGIQIELVDGEMFSWYGSRLLKAIPYFKSLLKRFN